MLLLPTTFSDLLLELAGGQRKRSQLAEALGKSYWQVNYWARNNIIPEEYWDDIIALAAKQKFYGVDRNYLRNLKKGKAR